MMNDINALLSQALSQKQSNRPGNCGFTGIVKAYQDLVFGFTYAMVRDYYLAQDITQDVFIIVYNKLETLRNPEAFSAWIRQIARRECLRVLKKKKHRELPMDSLEEQQSSQLSPPEVLEIRESQQEIQQVISRLPEGQRVPVILYYIDGYSQQDVADFLKIKLDTVKKRLQRARETLRKDMMHMIKDNLKHLRPSKNNKLVNKISLYTNFDMAARFGQITIMEQMLADGIDVNEKDATGKTLLHWAVENEHVEAVELLVRNGANPGIKDRAGHTALQLADNLKNQSILNLIRPLNQ